MPFTLSPSQVPALHSVPCSYRRQAPLPSQVPSWPQLTGDLGAQMVALLGFAPNGTKAQTPRELGRLQAMQVCPQAEVQQIPSTQNPLRHSRSQLQDSAVPLDWLGVSDEQVLRWGASTRWVSSPPPSSRSILANLGGVQAEAKRTATKARLDRSVRASTRRGRTIVRPQSCKNETSFPMDGPPHFIDGQLGQ
jgi:hypothetical protein